MHRKSAQCHATWQGDSTAGHPSAASLGPARQHRAAFTSRSCRLQTGTRPSAGGAGRPCDTPLPPRAVAAPPPPLQGSRQAHQRHQEAGGLSAGAAAAMRLFQLKHTRTRWAGASPAAPLPGVPMGGGCSATYCAMGVPVCTAAACSAAPNAAASGSAGKRSGSWKASATMRRHSLFLLPPPTTSSSLQAWRAACGLLFIKGQGVHSNCVYSSRAGAGKEVPGKAGRRAHVAATPKSCMRCMPATRLKVAPSIAAR